MRQMTDDEVRIRASELRKRHRSEWCQLVYEACVGRTEQEIADLLGFDKKWVRYHLDRYAIESASGGGGSTAPLERVEAGRRATEDAVRQVIKQFSPAQPDESYVEEYEAAGHTPEIAKRLARSYEAAEKAIDAGVIQESEEKGKSRIVLPSGTDWSIRLRRAVADVKSAAGLLNDAKITDLKRAETRKQVAAAHAAWMEQIERLQNFHPGFMTEVQTHEA